MNLFKNKKFLIILVVVILVTGSALIWRVSSQGGNDRDPQTSSNNDIPAVETIKVGQFQKEKARLSSIGKVEALQEVDLRSQLSREVKSVKVDIGDKVEKGELLVELDHSSLDAELEKSQASIERLEGQLAQQQAGATEEQIKKASSSVEQAQAALEQAKTKLNQTKANNEAMINNAEIGVELARANLNNQTTSTQQQLKNAYESLKLLSSNLLSTIRTALVSSGDILGKKPGDKNANDVYEDVLGAQNSQIKRQAERNFVKAREAYEKAREYKESLPQDISIEQGEKLDELVGEALEYTDQTLNDLQITLDNTVTTRGFPEVSEFGPSLQGLKKEVNTQISYIDQAQQNLQTQRQAVTNAEISSDNTAEQSRLNYQKALQNLEDSKQQAQANLESARSAVQAQERALEQARASYEQVVAPPREVDLASLKASIQEARAGKRLVEDKLEKAFIRAPFSGEVGSVPVKENELVSSGKVAVSLVNKSGLQVRSYVSPGDRKFLETGAQATISEEFPGAVSQVSPQVDPETKKVEIITAVTGENNGLVIGEYVEVNIQVSRNKEEDVFLLPFQTVKVTPQGNYVFMVNEENKIEKKKVEVGRVVNEYNEILDGVTSDMEIVSSIRGLSEGQEVRVK